MSRLLLQILNALIGLATVALGAMGLILGESSPIYRTLAMPESPILDSNLRFFGGMALALGLAMLWILPSLERRTGVYRVFWATAFAGGVGRLVSAAVTGVPSSMLVGFAVIEVVGAPLMVVWQANLVKTRDSG